MMKTYARRVGHSLSESSKSLLEALLPSVQIFPHDCEKLLERGEPLHLEIGFGDGSRLATIAAKQRNEIFIGCEPYVNGVCNLLKLIQNYRLDNILISTDDGRVILDAMPDHSLSSLHVLFPDPWPKLRHHKRRILNPDFILLAARKLIPNCKLRVATDHTEYSVFIEKAIKASVKLEPSLAYTYSTKAPDDWIATKYHIKAGIHTLIHYYDIYIVQ